MHSVSESNEQQHQQNQIDSDVGTCQKEKKSITRSNKVLKASLVFLSILSIGLMSVIIVTQLNADEDEYQPEKPIALTILPPWLTTRVRNVTTSRPPGETIRPRPTTTANPSSSLLLSRILEGNQQ